MALDFAEVMSRFLNSQRVTLKIAETLRIRTSTVTQKRPLRPDISNVCVFIVWLSLVYLGQVIEITGALTACVCAWVCHHARRRLHVCEASLWVEYSPPSPRVRSSV